MDEQMVLAQVNSFLGIIRKHELEIEELKRRLTNIQVDSLDEITGDLGQIGSGQLVFSNGQEYGDGMSGVFFGYPGMQINSEEWNLAGLENDVLQVGIRASDGKLYAVGGLLVLGNDALQLTGLADALKLIATYGGVTRTMRISMFLPPGSTTPAGLLSFESPAGTELLSNPDFETGDFTNWTTAGAGTWTVDGSSPTPHGGSYQAKITATQEQDADQTLTADAVNVTGASSYLLSFWQYVYGGVGWTHPDAYIKAELKWYDAAAGGGSLLRTDVIPVSPSEAAWKQVVVGYTSPAAALSVVLVVTANRAASAPIGSAYAVFDDFSFSEVTVGKSIYFAPELTVAGSGIVLPELAISPSTPPPGMVELSFRATGGYTLDDAGREWPLQPDDSGGQLYIANTTTETAIFTKTIPGGTLGAHGRFSVRLAGLFMNDSGGVKGFTLRIKANSTTLLTIVIPSMPGSADPHPVDMEIWWANIASESSVYIQQIISVWGAVAADTLASLSTVVGEKASWNTSTGVIDTSDDWTFSVTGQFTAANSALWYSSQGVQFFGPYKHT